MAQPVIAFVLERLGDLLIQEAIFLHGVSEKVGQLQTELRRMLSYLQDADRRQDEDRSLHNWVSEIRETAYDAEDVIERYALRRSLRKRRTRRDSVLEMVKKYTILIKELVEIHQVGSEVDAIISRISNYTTSLQVYGIRPEREVLSWNDGRQRAMRRSYSHIVEEDIIGLEEDVNTLVGQLVSVGGGCKVVSVCGMGGLGKTTLAKKVYHHSEVRHHFEGFAWACISLQCQARDVWEGILFKLTSPSKEQKEEIRSLRDEELARMLYQVQEVKKCLVVLDDIWSAEAWNNLIPGFPNGKASAPSKILITTRNTDVALHMDPTCFLHHPRYLNEAESWKLFQMKAFPQKDDPVDPEMENLGREMVGRCGGLPLAIIVLGGLLATKPTFHEWDMVLQNINSYLRRARGQQLLGVSEVLALSYYELPYQLKPCFLYLGHYPENFDIPTNKLIRMWVAEGIVSLVDHEEEGEETRENVAQRYLNELVERCMIQVVERSSTGRIRSIRMHNLMRDLCLSKAKNESFLEIIYSWSVNETVDCLSLSLITGTRSVHKVRRFAVFLDQDITSFIPSRYKSSHHLRSLIFFCEKASKLKEWGLMKFVFDNFKFLRLLDLEGIQGQEGKLPKEIGYLIHLRFLSLRNSDIDELPLTIGYLRCLQTLDLLTWNSTVKIPNVIWRMEQLRHLYLPESCGDSTEKWQLGNLRNLQTLVNFPTEKCDVTDLIKLINLRKLVIDDPIYGNIFKAQSVTFSHLESLSFVSNEETSVDQILIGCPNLYKLHIEGPIDKLPERHQISSKLAKLKLQGSRLQVDPMATLEKLPNLKILELQMDSCMGKMLVCSEKGFPQLKCLVLDDLTNLKEWKLGKGAMANLHQLQISNCTKLNIIPEGLRFITTLEELEIRSMFKAFRTKLEKGGEHHYKVQHVPTLAFRYCDY